MAVRMTPPIRCEITRKFGFFQDGPSGPSGHVSDPHKHFFLGCWATQNHFSFPVTHRWLRDMTPASWRLRPKMAHFRGRYFTPFWRIWS